uniref:Aminodehydroquinate synthase n=1 Tax=Streptomyces collinus TaxID=42684 RepID=Q9X656_STRCU|nr:aminodehydroquinate synthase [Streptomyces collinus]
MGATAVRTLIASSRDGRNTYRERLPHSRERPGSGIPFPGGLPSTAGRQGKGHPDRTDSATRHTISDSEWRTPGPMSTGWARSPSSTRTRAYGVVSVGGGTTTDVVGLAAALFHRGVPVVQLPTTLLAQVYTGVGGRTAVNPPEGKNLIGAHGQPSAVLCDTDDRETLPGREMLNGHGEIARCDFIGAGDLRELTPPVQIAASVARKAQTVSADERDTGLRDLPSLDGKDGAEPVPDLPEQVVARVLAE